MIKMTTNFNCKMFCYCTRFNWLWWDCLRFPTEKNLQRIYLWKITISTLSIVCLTSHFFTTWVVCTVFLSEFYPIITWFLIDFLNQNILAEKFSNVNYYNIFYFICTYNIAAIYIVLSITSNQNIYLYLYNVCRLYANTIQYLNSFR